MGFQMPIKIAETIAAMQTNGYVLPAIQREFVWTTGQIEKLFDSLMRGYPIGSFLFWQILPQSMHDFQFYRFMDHYHERDHRHNEPITLTGPAQAIAVLDGQQRLTALNIGLKGWFAEKLPWYRWNNPAAFPEQRLYLNLLRPAQDSDLQYDFRMLRDNEVRNDDGDYWFKVGDVLKFASMADAFAYCVANGLTASGAEYPWRTLTELWLVVNQKPLINYFLETEADLDKVLNIFIRVNSGGTPLSYSDMLLSIATAQWKHTDARKEIYGLVDFLNTRGDGFEFDKDYVMKTCLVISDTPAIEFRANSFTRGNMLQIEGMWAEIERSLQLTADLLVSWGYNRQTLVSYNATIPIAYYLHRLGSPGSFITSSHFARDRETMLRWLRVALLKRTFGGQSDVVLRAIREAIRASQDGFPTGEIGRALGGTAKTMSFTPAEVDGLLDYRFGQGYTFSVLAMLYPSLHFDQVFHIDHIFPRGLFTAAELRRRGIPEDRWGLWLDHVNDIANLQLLQAIPNIQKSDQEFEAWLVQSAPTPSDLHSYRALHLIPDVDFAFESFPEFLTAREGLIRQRLGELLLG